jgi:methylmalonyl-CoA/ethylmalonyl-CoA epimerase
MLGRLNHVALAVPDLEIAARLYRDTLGAQVSAPQSLPEHGVRIVFVELPNTRIELMEPLGENSPIAAFLAKNLAGGMHHICYEVDDIRAAIARLKREGVRILGDGEPKTGAHGRPVVFLSPKDFAGTLIELEEAAK